MMARGRRFDGAYSPEMGDLEDYLRSHRGGCADNLFYGSEYFFVMKERGWIVPGQTGIRVDESPIPDASYFVNSDFMLESRGGGTENMSCMPAKKGVYNPSRVLKSKRWSIIGFRLNR